MQATLEAWGWPSCRLGNERASATFKIWVWKLFGLSRTDNPAPSSSDVRCCCHPCLHVDDEHVTFGDMSESRFALKFKFNIGCHDMYSWNSTSLEAAHCCQRCITQISSTHCPVEHRHWQEPHQKNVASVLELLLFYVDQTKYHHAWSMCCFSVVSLHLHAERMKMHNSPSVVGDLRNVRLWCFVL